MYEHIECEPASIDIEAAVADTAHMLEDWPFRGPASVPHALRPYIEGKRVCDLGCGGGDLAWSMGRWAAEVVGVELDDTRYKRAVSYGSGINPLRQLDNVKIKKLNYFKALPLADVYYFWPNDPNSIGMLIDTMEKWGQKSLLCAGARLPFLESEREGKTLAYSKGPRHCRLLEYTDRYNGKVLSFPYKERSVLDNWPGEGTYVAALIPMKGYEI